MERLTFRDKDGYVHIKRQTTYTEIIERLAELEDKEEEDEKTEIL